MRTTSVTVASFPFVAYAPLFLSQELGFFANEGLDVSLKTHGGSWSELEGLLDAGQVDLAVGALWFAMRRAGGRKPVVAVAACARHCRYVIAAARQTPSDSFRWSDLLGKTVVVPSGIPTPWFAFREALRRSGVPIEAINPLVGFNVAESIEEVLSYGADYVLLDIENAQDDRLREVASLAEPLGPVPWSVFCALEDSLEQKSTEFASFRRALSKSLIWIHQESTEEISKHLYHHYPNVPGAHLRRALDRYRKLELWPLRPDVSKSDARAWQAAIVGCGGLTAPSDIDRIVPLIRS